MTESDRIDAVVKKVLVPGPPGAVFELFTTRIDEWWPRATHSVGGEHAAVIRMESGVGGRIYEVTDDGVEHTWGTILAWEPGARLSLTWHPGLTVERATRIEVGFGESSNGTEVTLIHDGWEARGGEGRQVREEYDTGWDLVLGRVPGSTRIESPAPG